MLSKGGGSCKLRFSSSLSCRGKASWPSLGEGYRTDVLFNCNKMSQLFYSLPQQMKAIAFFSTLSTCGTNFRKLCICILGLLVLQHFPRTLSFTVYFLPWFKFPNSFTLHLSELNSIWCSFAYFPSWYRSCSHPFSLSTTPSFKSFPSYLKPMLSSFKLADLGLHQLWIS